MACPPNRLGTSSVRLQTVSGRQVDTLLFGKGREMAVDLLRLGLAPGVERGHHHHEASNEKGVPARDYADHQRTQAWAHQSLHSGDGQIASHVHRGQLSTFREVIRRELPAEDPRAV